MIYPLLFAFLLAWADAAKILLIMPQPTKSHNNIFTHLAKLLGAKGHQVTYISPYPLTKPLPNVELIQTESNEFTESGEIQKHIYKMEKQNSISLLESYRDFFFLSCENLYKNAKVKSIIADVHKKKIPLYDVAITDALFSEYALPLAAMSAKHVMYLSVVSLQHWVAHHFRIPTPPTIVPTMLIDYVPKTFLERFGSIINAYTTILYMNYYFIPNLQKEVDKYVPKGAPTIWEAMDRISFILVNDDPIMTIPKPSVSFVAEIGGIHLQESNPLPKDLENFMKSSEEDGVILFSFGSLVEARHMPANVRQAFINAFSRLKQKVIWKYEEDLPGVSDNVKVVPWMPQKDILGHPQLRLFITHGGRLSLQEVTFHGVPIIGIPILGDQAHNIAVIEEAGFCVKLDFHNITEESVFTLVNKVLNDRRYAARAKEASSIVRDKMSTSAESAVFWVEYVIRHKGAHYLRSKTEKQLNLIQYMGLDILAVILLAFILVIYIIHSLIHFILRLLPSNKRQHQRKQKIK